MAGFEDKLAILGWSKGELSRRLGIHRNTISRWDEAPGYAEAYLDLAENFLSYRNAVRKRVRILAEDLDAEQSG